ncbi:hypothetical protein [Thermococcus sp. GR6]|uniref:hypothetical protein n=1 Tax=Thermococcus sp. GR6 TaxID=1638256 RepID=UPI001F0FC6F6|nr:hypothetical protein [Thermococcus sp. GR6]
MEEKDKRLIEYTVEALIVAWLSYLFFYQNYLLYNWHRGLPLPSKWPFLLVGIGIGALFFWNEWRKFEKELSEGSVYTEGTPRTPTITKEMPEDSSQELLNEDLMNDEVL